MTATGNGTTDDRYLDLLKRVLIGMVPPDPPSTIFVAPGQRSGPNEYIERFRIYGRDAPSRAWSAIGLKRMENLHFAIRTVIEEDVPGDLIETGVWRGGATIFMRAALEALGDPARNVWVADSFRGLPEVDPGIPEDEPWATSAGWLAVSREEVESNFRAVGLLDDRVRFLEGWFEDTLPSSPVRELAVLRLDGDLYASTMTALVALYDRVSPGGFVIVDDYVLTSCRTAVETFRRERGITDEILDIDGWAVYWRKSS